MCLEQQSQVEEVPLKELLTPVDHNKPLLFTVRLSSGPAQVQLSSAQVQLLSGWRAVGVFVACQHGQ